jgi:glycosyltransferase involved in cell wall biosynthesis
MFIVPCKYNPLCLIEKTVESIRKLYPTTKILVVDSNSDDKSYAKKLEQYDVIFADIKNSHYESGAFWYAVDKYKEDFYVVMQDSVILNKSIDEQINSEELFYCFINFFEDSMANHMRTEPFAFISRINEMLGEFEPVPSDINTFYSGVFGPNFIIKREMVDMMLDKKCHITLRPTNKHEHQIQERVYGLIAKQCGVNVIKNTLIGNLHELMRGPGFNHQEETLKTDLITKTWLNKHRQ